MKTVEKPSASCQKMIALEECELDAICITDGKGRIRLNGGLFLPGEIVPEGYRAFNYCFVCCSGMDGVALCGIPLKTESVIVEPRIVATVAKAGIEGTLARSGTIKMLSLRDAVAWIQDNFTIHNGMVAPWPNGHCPHKEWADSWVEKFKTD